MHCLTRFPITPDPVGRVTVTSAGNALALSLVQHSQGGARQSWWTVRLCCQAHYEDAQVVEPEARPGQPIVAGKEGRDRPIVDEVWRHILLGDLRSPGIDHLAGQRRALAGHL